MLKIAIRSILAISLIIIFIILYNSVYYGKNFNNTTYYSKYPNATHYPVPKKNIYYFGQLHGPTDPTVIPKPIPTSYKKFSSGANSDLAILLTDTNSSWLLLAHGLKSIGIPFIITRNYQDALHHKVVFVYPAITNELSAKELSALANFPLKGGFLIGQNVLASSLFQTFGFKQAKRAQKNISELHFNTQFNITKNFTNLEERVITIGNKEITGAAYAYLKPTETPLANYEDGSAAITQMSHLKGKTYAIGVDISTLLHYGFDNRQYSSINHHIAKDHVDSYNPTIDVLLQLIKNIYLEGQTNGVTLGIVPYGKSLAVIMTHDIDAYDSAENSLEYAKIELKHHIKATYFIQTKYITDSNDKVFFNKSSISIYKMLSKQGMELTSHSVSHSLQFENFPIGTGKEQYPNYVPYVMQTDETQSGSILGQIAKTVTYNGSILGELRVSRFLLQYFFPDQNVISFRSGYLRNPHALPQALAATGFKYDSSVTANDSLTHLPFQLNYNRNYYMLSSTEVPVYEFPLTLEDQANPPMLNRLPQAFDLAKKISHFGGIYVILIHPNITGQKLKFEDKFLSKIKTIAPIWFGTLEEYGNWWQARDQIRLDVINKGQTQIVTISAPLEISGLTLNVPNNFKYISNNSKLDVTQIGTNIVINHLLGKVQLLFKIGKSNYANLRAYFLTHGEFLRSAE